jgi:hypothetical protein
MVKIIIISIVVLVLIFIFYRYYATIRATQKRDKQVLDLIAPVVLEIQSGKTPDYSKINTLADDSLTRGNLYMLLNEKGKSELFPEKYKNSKSSAESQLVFWLLHPNELGARPSVIELAEIITRPQESIDYKFFVFKFKWNFGPKDKNDTWTVGVSGPFDESKDPYKQGTAFSTFGNYEDQSADKHVDWFINRILDKAQV